MTRSFLAALIAVVLIAPLANAQAPAGAPIGPPLSAPAGPPDSASPPVTGLSLEPAAAQSGGDRVWVDAEYLLWWMRGQSLPALVTTSPTGTPIGSAGVLGTSGTTVLFGDSSANTGVRSGGRIEVGTWIDDGDIFGVQSYFFMLATKATNFSATSTGSPILARPFINALDDSPVALRVAFPGEFSGSVDADAATTGLIGTGLLARSNLLCGGNYRLDVLGGYSFLRFADRLGVSEDQTASVGNPDLLVPGTHITSGDLFATKNTFNGFDVGLDGEFRRGPVSLELIGNLAVGFNQQDVDIFGATTVTVPGSPPVSSTGGLLALSSNIGHHSRVNEVSLIPEFEAKLGYQVTPRVRLTVGYTVLYWNNVVRAADQVDRLVNPNLLPNSGSSGGPNNPFFQFNRDNIWIQGLELGLEFRF
jgi:Putative beta barrel porin-7 (BBP7)